MLCSRYHHFNVTEGTVHEVGPDCEKEGLRQRKVDNLNTAEEKSGITAEEKDKEVFHNVFSSFFVILFLQTFFRVSFHQDIIVPSSGFVMRDFDRWRSKIWSFEAGCCMEWKWVVARFLPPEVTFREVLRFVFCCLLRYFGESYHSYH